MVERTRLNVTLYVHRLSSCILTKLAWWWHFNKLKHVARGNVKNYQQIKSCVREGNSVTCQFIEHWCPHVIRNYFCGTRLLSTFLLLSGAHTVLFEFCYCKDCNTKPSLLHQLPDYAQYNNKNHFFFFSAPYTVAQQSFCLCFIAGIYNSDVSWAAKRPTTTSASIGPALTLILPCCRTGTVWFYTSTSNKRAVRPKLYTKSLTRDLKLMYSRFTLVRISINL